MFDPPRGDAVLLAVARWLRESALPALPPALVFQARVAANAVELAAREIAEAPAARERARERLAGLLGHDGALEALETELASAIQNGQQLADSPEVLEHLLVSAIDKVAIDQPSYASLRAELAGREAPSP
jgi:hypothetical protein